MRRFVTLTFVPRPPLQVIETVSAVDKDEMAHRQHFSFSLAPEVLHNQNFSLKDNRGGRQPSGPDRHADCTSPHPPPDPLSSTRRPSPSPHPLLSALLAEMRSKPNQMEPCATSWASGSRCSGSPHTPCPAGRINCGGASVRLYTYLGEGGRGRDGGLD